MVGTDVDEVERALLGGELGCPACGGRLGPWGWARRRVVRAAAGVEERRPRRSRCVGCRSTHVLLAADSLVRRRDLVAVIGAALLARARGLSYRRVAAAISWVTASTVRGWLRRFTVNAEQVRVLFTVLAHDLDPELAPIEPTGSAVGDAVEAMAVAARAASSRLTPMDPWQFASMASRGLLLGNAGCRYRAAV